MATANCTLTYVRTMDKGTNETSATYHFGYGNAGQRWVTCYKVTVPSYTGTPSSITFSLNVNRGTAYPTNKNSTWKIGLDESAPVWSAADGAYTAGSAYAAGWYDKGGSWQGTFSGSITSTTVSKVVTISTSSAILDGGNTFYVYLFSGANAYNSIKVTSISAYITYSSEAVTGTTLYVGTTSSPTSTTAYPTPNKRTVYYRVAGLANPVKNYSQFRVYLSEGFSMSAITDSQYGTVGYTPYGTCIDTYSNASSSAYEFTRSFSIPNANFKIGAITGIVVVASTTTYPNRYWRIGTRSGSTYLPVVRNIWPASADWYANVIDNTVKVTGKTSVQYSSTHSTSNNPQYVKWIGATSGKNYSAAGENTDYSPYLEAATSWDSGTYLPAYTSATTNNYVETGLSPGTTYTRYFVAGSAWGGTTTYANYNYFGLKDVVTFTTDANYSGTNTSSVTSATTATITSTVNNTTNLDGYIYYSTSSGLKSRPSTKQAYSSKKITVNLTNLTANKKHDYYFYVYSSESGILYSIGSTSFTTDASSYTQTTTVSSEGITDATINTSTPSPTTNLDGKTYFSINSNSSPVSSLNIVGSGSYGGNIVISNLQSDKSYTLYTYVKSSVTGKYYPTGTVDTFSTLAPNYTADCLVTGIGTDCAYLFATNFSSTNLDGYYVTDVDYGDEATPEADIVNYKVGLRESKFVSNLVPGMTYTYYFYVLPSSGNLQKINSLTFTTRSSVVYYGENLTPHRIYMVRNGRLEGISLYREGTPEILYLEDGSTITTSDGLVFNTTEGDIDI